MALLGVEGIVGGDRQDSCEASGWNAQRLFQADHHGGEVGPLRQAVAPAAFKGFQNRGGDARLQGQLPEADPQFVTALADLEPDLDGLILGTVLALCCCAGGPRPSPEPIQGQAHGLALSSGCHSSCLSLRQDPSGRLSRLIPASPTRCRSMTRCPSPAAMRRICRFRPSFS